MTVSAESQRMELSSFLHAWSESFERVLEQIGGSPVPCAVLSELPGEMPAAGEADSWILAACSGALRGEMSIRIPPQSTLALARFLLREPAGPDAGMTSHPSQAALELLRQIGGFTATALKPRWGEVQVRLDSFSAPASWPSSSTVWLRAGDERKLVLLEMHLSPALMAALRAERISEEAPPAPSSADSPPDKDSDGKTDRNLKLGLLMDVQLGVTLRFGSRRLLLREILDLNPGSVVELDRQVNEAVDLLLDGRLLARGEVVVVDGNYGLRVTEVAPPGQG